MQPETLSIVGIVAILTPYLVGQIKKIAPHEHLPLISGLIGLAGVFIARLAWLGPEADLITSIALGIAAGLAPVGAHQIKRQYQKAREGRET